MVIYDTREGPSGAGQMPGKPKSLSPPHTVCCCDKAAPTRPGHPFLQEKRKQKPAASGQPPPGTLLPEPVEATLSRRPGPPQPGWLFTKAGLPRGRPQVTHSKQRLGTPRDPTPRHAWPEPPSLLARPREAAVAFLSSCLFHGVTAGLREGVELRGPDALPGSVEEWVSGAPSTHRGALLGSQSV